MFFAGDSHAGLGAGLLRIRVNKKTRKRKRRRRRRRGMMNRTKWLFAVLMLAGATCALAQGRPRVAQIVALDECDPTTFNAAVGAGFCKNVALGAQTTLSDLFNGASQGHPDSKWDFEPDTLTVDEGTILSVVDQGGEPHTFTEVADFGGGFIPPLNGPGEETAPECSGGFSNVAVAKTRILQGSTSLVTGLSKGKHHFQCCIHPWMRVDVEVK
jgi:plastocyanin